MRTTCVLVLGTTVEDGSRIWRVAFSPAVSDFLIHHPTHDGCALDHELVYSYFGKSKVYTEKENAIAVGKMLQSTGSKPLRILEYIPCI